MTILGTCIAVVVYLVTSDLLHTSAIMKPNYANHALPALGGLIALMGVLLCAALLVFIPRVGHENLASYNLVVIVLGFGMIGLIDDLLGDKDRQGFKGHIRALLSGNITTGVIKLFGGPLVALLAFSGQIPSRGYISVLIDVIAIALIANFFNLLDLAPGRCSKYTLFVLIVVAAIVPTPSFQYCIIGIVALCLVFDIREKFMLGDTGANVLGALAGLAIVSISSDFVTVWIVAVAFLLNLLSEYVSYSRIINAFLPLRFVDELGQLARRRAWAKEKRQR